MMWEGISACVGVKQNIRGGRVGFCRVGVERFEGMWEGKEGLGVSSGGVGEDFPPGGVSGS